MVCKNCGYQAEDNAIFCEQCGARIVPDVSEASQTSGVSNASETSRTSGVSHASEAPRKTKSRTPIYIAIAAALVLIIGAGAGFAIWYLFPSSKESTQDDVSLSESEISHILSSQDKKTAENNVRSSSNTDSDSSETDRPIREPDNTQDKTAQNNIPFTIDPNADADYASALDPSKYEFYTSGIDEFNFFYPTKFYNEVAYNTSPDAGPYGTNMEEVVFSAEDGSQLTFQAVRRTDTLDVESMSGQVYAREFKQLTSPEVILNKISDGSGKVIVTGWSKEHPGNTIYCLTKIEQNTIFQMVVRFPDYTDSTDRLRKSYITECYYRMCGFSGADPWRTYEDFIKENS